MSQQWDPSPAPATLPANRPINLPSAPKPPESYESGALESSAVVRTKTGVVSSVMGVNTLGSAQYIMLFDADSLPADGTVPKRVKKAAASETFTLDVGIRGVKVVQGLVIANSTTANTLTLGAANCLFHVAHDDLW